MFYHYNVLYNYRSKLPLLALGVYECVRVCVHMCVDSFAPYKLQARRSFIEEKYANVDSIPRRRLVPQWVVGSLNAFEEQTSSKCTGPSLVSSLATPSHSIDRL